MSMKMIAVTVALPMHLNDRLHSIVERLNTNPGSINTDNLRASRNRSVTRNSLLWAMIECEVECYEEMLDDQDLIKNIDN